MTEILGRRHPNACCPDCTGTECDGICHGGNYCSGRSQNRYRIDRKLMGVLRVVDRKKQQTDGYWWPDEKRWFDVPGFIEKPRQDYLHALATAYLSVPGH